MQRLLLVLALLSFGASCRAETREDLRYAITTNGISFGELSLHIVKSDSAYFLGAGIISHGILGFITQAQYSAQSAGSLDSSGNMRPGVFRSRSNRLIRTRTISLTFHHGRPVASVVEPESARTRLSDPAAIQGEYVDSLTALVSLATAAPPDCPPETRIYDGRRIVRITLAPAAAPPGMFRCLGSYRIVDGPDHTLLQGQKSFELTLDYDLSVAPYHLATANVAASGYQLVLTRQ